MENRAVQVGEQPSGGSPSIVSPEDQRVTFVELFFDLVFVFSVTQVVGLLHEGLHWAAIGQAVLVFWLVWWAWTQFTWALNAANTTHPLVELGTLVATAVAFFMAVAVPDSFHGHPLAFAVPYVLVRIVGLGIYAWVAGTDPVQRSAVRTFSLVSATGLASVLVGAALGGSYLYAFWGLTILLDVVAAGIGGRQEGWNLHPEHFCERHGLIVIIALGETLIVAAGGIVGLSWTGPISAVAVLSVAITCALWWSYFVEAKGRLEQAMEAREDAKRASLARDIYSLLHFPMLCGVIAYAAALEEAIAHPAEPLTLDARLALAVGIALFLGGMALALWRATGRLPLHRAVLALATAGGVTMVAGVPPAATLAIALLGTVALAIVEPRLA